MALRSAASAELAPSAFLAVFPSLSSSRTARAFSRTSGDAWSAFAWMASTRPSSVPASMALRSAASAAVAGEAESVGVIASRTSSLSLARRARASSSTSIDALSALAWMTSTRVSSRPWEGHGPFIALCTAASAADCTLGSIPLRTAVPLARPFTGWRDATSKCSESAPADGWLKKGGRAQMAAASNMLPPESGRSESVWFLVGRPATGAE